MAVVRRQVRVNETVQVYAALGHPLRLRAVMFLAGRPHGGAYACEVVAHLCRAQSTVSHHLKVLTEAGLLRTETHGSWSWYGLVPARFREFGEHLTWFSATTPLPAPGVVGQS